MPEDLETVDLDAVEILAVGGPIHGTGSPPEGDHWTSGDLRAMADAAAELANEIKPPAKIGHSKEQPASAGNAVGWLRNIRLSDDGSKLLSDIADVPRGFAELIKAKAYRTRSVELAKVTSQKTGKTYDWVVTGLAWLGDKLPAVHTLDDVVALYEADGVERRFVLLEEHRIEVEPERLLEAVFDLAGTLVELAGKTAGTSADSRANVAERKYTDEQVKAFAEATGLDEEKVTDDMLEAAGVPTESPEGDGGGEGDGDSEGGESAGGSDEEASRALEARIVAAEKAAAEANEKLRLSERKTFVDAAIKDGKVKPGAREKLERLYDKDPEGAAAFVAEIAPDPELAREYGSDEEAEGDDELKALEKAYEADLASRIGVKAEELI